jgi:hypothetical protein
MVAVVQLDWATSCQMLRWREVVIPEPRAPSLSGPGLRPTPASVAPTA